MPFVAAIAFSASCRPKAHIVNFLSIFFDIKGRCGFTVPYIFIFPKDFFASYAVWYVTASSMGVTADFFTLCREKMRHGAGYPC